MTHWQAVLAFVGIVAALWMVIWAGLLGGAAPAPGAEHLGDAWSVHSDEREAGQVG